MAPFTFSPLHQCRASTETPFIQSKTTSELLSSNPRDRSPGTFIMRTRNHLKCIIQRIVKIYRTVTELLRSRMISFCWARENTTMAGKESTKSGVDLPRWEDPGMMELDEETEEEFIEEVKSRLSQCESDEESDEEEDHNSETQEDDDSEWSDEDSEESTENHELWESFFNTGDPYNPLNFCPSTGSRTNTQQNRQTPSDAEERHPKLRPKSSKKVRFCDEVIVRPLVVYSFASRAARDGYHYIQMAVDRERFRRRVEHLETVISPCLSTEHRDAVYERLQKHVAQNQH